MLEYALDDLGGFVLIFVSFRFDFLLIIIITNIGYFKIQMTFIFSLKAKLESYF